jgi:hypothetical protein
MWNCEIWAHFQCKKKVIFCNDLYLKGEHFARKYAFKLDEKSSNFGIMKDYNLQKLKLIDGYLQYFSIFFKEE